MAPPSPDVVRALRILIARKSPALAAFATIAARNLGFKALSSFLDYLTAMPREAEPSNNERAFILEALQQNIRLDGRALDAFRNINLTFGEDYGVADVQLGKTRHSHTLTKDDQKQRPNREQSPRPHLRLHNSTLPRSKVRRHLHRHHRALPNGIPRVRGRKVRGSQTDTETLLSRLLEVALRRSSALSTESLCLLAGQKVWSLSATCHVLSHDGNLLDAACIAVLAALQHYRIPDTTVKGEEVIVHGVEERNPVPLAMLHHPLCATMALFEGGEKVVVDATLREQQCCEGEVVVTANKHGEVVQVKKLGGVPADALVLLNCMDIAVAKVKELDLLITKSLEQDARERDVGGLMAELRAENER
ncbi:MAG: hypothetical protein Q9216_001032 [Gyalolechia sp. 2 TL-2023]